MLRDLLPFAQFEKRENHPWRSVNLSKVAGLKPAKTIFLLVETCFTLVEILIFVVRKSFA